MGHGRIDWWSKPGRTPFVNGSSAELVDTGAAMAKKTNYGSK